jgi:hypothetical protein
MHTYIHIDTFTDTDTDTDAHIHIDTYTDTYMHACTHPYIHTYIPVRREGYFVNISKVHTLVFSTIRFCGFRVRVSPSRDQGLGFFPTLPARRLGLGFPLPAGSQGPRLSEELGLRASLPAPASSWSAIAVLGSWTFHGQVSVFVSFQPEQTEEAFVSVSCSQTPLPAEQKPQPEQKPEQTQAKSSQK